MILVATTNIVTPGGTLPAGSVVTEKQMSSEDAMALLKKGALKEVDEGEVTEKVVTPPLASETEPDPAPAPESDPKAWQWAFDPKVLEGADLDMLNIMASDHCETHGIERVEPFTSVQEALAFMTQDLD